MILIVIFSYALSCDLLGTFADTMVNDNLFPFESDGALPWLAPWRTGSPLPASPIAFGVNLQSPSFSYDTQPHILLDFYRTLPYLVVAPGAIPVNVHIAANISVEIVFTIGGTSNATQVFGCAVGDLNATWSLEFGGSCELAPLSGANFSLPLPSTGFQTPLTGVTQCLQGGATNFVFVWPDVGFQPTSYAGPPSDMCLRVRITGRSLNNFSALGPATIPRFTAYSTLYAQPIIEVDAQQCNNITTVTTAATTGSLATSTSSIFTATTSASATAGVVISTFGVVTGTASSSASATSTAASSTVFSSTSSTSLSSAVTALATATNAASSFTSALAFAADGASASTLVASSTLTESVSVGATTNAIVTSSFQSTTSSWSESTSLGTSSSSTSTNTATVAVAVSTMATNGATATYSFATTTFASYVTSYLTPVPPPGQTTTSSSSGIWGAVIGVIVAILLVIMISALCCAGRLRYLSSRYIFKEKKTTPDNSPTGSSI